MASLIWCRCTDTITDVSINASCLARKTKCVNPTNTLPLTIGERPYCHRRHCPFKARRWRKWSRRGLVSPRGSSCIRQSLSSFPTVHWPWVPGIDFLWRRAERGSLPAQPLPCGVIRNRFLKSQCSGDGSPVSEDHQSSLSVTRVTTALNLSSYKQQTWQRSAGAVGVVQLMLSGKRPRSWNRTHTRPCGPPCPTLAGSRIHVSPPLTPPWQSCFLSTEHTRWEGG